ncbi:uncharacterized protein LOC132904094 [Amyelois transitella]|uniref:uncharacterized protein LOC132904094 n=1 Tax=Amyelois transitella TaxID=680683 RepID=UPI00298FB752|nr:uncharacterized protein LOC132904094 [Amyelois transitella]
MALPRGVEQPKPMFSVLSAPKERFLRCPNSFHYQCLGVPSENFSKESKTYKATWKCQDCKLADSRVTTPSPATTDTSPSNIGEDLKTYLEKLLEEHLSKFSRDIKRDFAAESVDTRSKLQELTESIVYMSSRYEEVKADLESKENRIRTLETENAGLKSQVVDLNTRLNNLEQQSRDCNIEIQCVPEHKSENLSTIVKQLSATVGLGLREHEVLNYHRVAKVNQDSSRPRSIVVKLSSPLVRDNLIAAVKTFNRVHQHDKLNSSHFGLAGERTPVYICEHLSPSNKQLHAAARKFAKEKKYQFVWVRNGKVHLRKDPTSKSFVVRDIDFLSTL